MYIIVHSFIRFHLPTEKNYAHMHARVYNEVRQEGKKQFSFHFTFIHLQNPFKNGHKKEVNDSVVFSI